MREELCPKPLDPKALPPPPSFAGAPNAGAEDEPPPKAFTAGLFCDAPPKGLLLPKALTAGLLAVLVAKGLLAVADDAAPKSPPPDEDDNDEPKAPPVFFPATLPPPNALVAREEDEEDAEVLKPPKGLAGGEEEAALLAEPKPPKPKLLLNPPSPPVAGVAVAAAALAAGVVVLVPNKVEEEGGDAAVVAAVLAPKRLVLVAVVAGAVAGLLRPPNENPLVFAGAAVAAALLVAGVVANVVAVVAVVVAAVAAAVVAAFVGAVDDLAPKAGNESVLLAPSPSLKEKPPLPLAGLAAVEVVVAAPVVATAAEAATAEAVAVAVAAGAVSAFFAAPNENPPVLAAVDVEDPFAPKPSPPAAGLAAALNENPLVFLDDGAAEVEVDGVAVVFATLAAVVVVVLAAALPPKLKPPLPKEGVTFLPVIPAGVVTAVPVLGFAPNDRVDAGAGVAAPPKEKPEVLVLVDVAVDEDADAADGVDLLLLIPPKLRELAGVLLFAVHAVEVVVVDEENGLAAPPVKDPDTPELRAAFLAPPNPNDVVACAFGADAPFAPNDAEPKEALPAPNEATEADDDEEEDEDETEDNFAFSMEEAVSGDSLSSSLSGKVSAACAYALTALPSAAAAAAVG